MGDIVAAVSWLQLALSSLLEYLTMAKPKRHHYVPESYMSRFALKDRIWLFDRQLVHVRRDTPHNVAVEGDYYTLRSSLGVKDVITEERLAEVDDRGKLALDKLEDGRVLTLEERWAVSLFIGFLDTRGPSFQRALREMSKDTARVFAVRTAERVERQATALSSEFVSGDLKRMIGDHDVHDIPDRALEIALMVNLAFEFACHICWMAWIVTHNTSQTDYITSDRPIAVKPPSGWTGPYGSLMRGVSNIFPVSGRTCLMFGAEDRSRGLAKAEMGADGVEKINDRMLLTCERYVIAKHEKAVRRAASLLADTPGELHRVLELYDKLGDRSLFLSLTLRSDVQFPFVARLLAKCRQCGNANDLALELDEGPLLTQPFAYSEWLDNNCSGCGLPRRSTTHDFQPTW